jgi:hypothetical protein
MELLVDFVVLVYIDRERDLATSKNTFYIFFCAFSCWKIGMDSGYLYTRVLTLEIIGEWQDTNRNNNALSL